MGVVRIEPDDRVSQSTCDGCGGTTWMILGYVYEDEHPAAIYYVDWCEGEHDTRRAVITLSVGNYADEEATAADRRFAAVAAWLCGHLDTALDADDDAPARAG